MIKTLLKIAFAGALIYWLVNSGRLDFEILKKSFTYPTGWVICFLGILANILIGTYRWKSILEQNSTFSYQYLKVLRIQWIGLLFNTALPGAVSGDFVKLLYVKDIDSQQEKSYLLTSVLMDRIFGLIGLITLMGVTSLIFYSELIQISEHVATLIHLNFLIFIGIAVFFFTLFLTKKIQDRILSLVAKLPGLGPQVRKVFFQFFKIGTNRKLVFKSVSLSVVAQFFSIVAFYFIAAPFFDSPLPFKYGLSFIPLGMISLALPVAPSGLGVGHAVFDILFGYFHISKGASLFNFFFLSTISINLLGIFPYLWGSKKHSMKEANQFENAL